MRSGALPVAAPSSALPSIFIVLPPLPSANVPESFAGEPPFRFNTAFSYVKGSHDAAGGDVAAHDFDRDHRISANAHSHSAHQTYAKAAPHYATRMSN